LIDGSGHSGGPLQVAGPDRGSFAFSRAPRYYLNSASLAGCSILIFEDEPLIALDIPNAFSKAGARVVTVHSLANALIAVEEEVPSAVILHHVLYDGESSQLRECLKERNIPYVVPVGTPKHMTGRLTTLYACPNLHRLNTL
jgi:hypothetical protein